MESYWSTLGENGTCTCTVDFCFEHPIYQECEYGLNVIVINNTSWISPNTTHNIHKRDTTCIRRVHKMKFLRSVNQARDGIGRYLCTPVWPLCVHLYDWFQPSLHPLKMTAQARVFWSKFSGVCCRPQLQLSSILSTLSNFKWNLKQSIYGWMEFNFFFPNEGPRPLKRGM